MELTVAAPQVSDRAALLRLLAAQLDEHGIPLAAGRLAQAVDGVLADPRRGFFLLALVDGAAAGVAYVSYIWALEHGGLAAWLEELYVEPARRERGIGRRLLDEVLARAAAAGCAAVDLEIEEDHTRAASLYARAGFRAHRRARWVRQPVV